MGLFSALTLPLLKIRGGYYEFCRHDACGYLFYMQSHFHANHRLEIEAIHQAHRQHFEERTLNLLR